MKRLSTKELTDMINAVMGQKVLTQPQLNQILAGAKKAGERGGMDGILRYLMRVTQADVDFKELKQFAESVRSNPDMGMDMLKNGRGNRGKKW